MSAGHRKPSREGPSATVLPQAIPIPPVRRAPDLSAVCAVALAWWGGAGLHVGRPAAEGARGEGRVALARRIAAATPEGRDRYLDALRVWAVLMVVLGHWLVRGVVAPEGAAEAVYLLAVAPGWLWATPLFQVMPLIFLVGGAVNAASWRRARAEGMAPVDWLRRRARRLLRPALPLLLVLVPGWVLVDALLQEGVLVLAPGVALVPLWFLAAYLAVTALTPWSLALHDRGWSLPLIAVAAGLAGLVDLIRLAGVGPVLGTQPLAGTPNFLLVWGAVHQLGHLWERGPWPERPSGQLALAGAGLAALGLLIGEAGWPLAMVPVEGTLLPNNAAPPTLALMALGLVQAGLAGLARGPVTRWLERPRVWVWVALPGARLIPLFLWHQAVQVAVTNAALALGWMPLAEAVGAQWWTAQLVALGPMALLLAALVAALAQFERPAGPPPSAGAGATLAGVVMVAAGIAGLLWVHVADVPASLALAALALLLAGFRGVGALGRGGSGRAR